MKVKEADCWNRLVTKRHGVLGTLHPDRGVDLVPVVYGVDDDRTIFVPVDAVKAKETTRLQRLVNLAADPRCTLLVDEYDDDWSRLWWVRVNGHGAEASAGETEAFRRLLSGRYPQYLDPKSIAGGMLIHPVEITGWEAG